MTRPICPPEMPLADRIRFKSAVDANGCWIWQASISSTGYGVIGFGGRSYRAHRVSYEQLVGPIPEGLDLDHLCRVRACVNPAHLEPVTRGENIRRGDHHERRRTHCDNGHPFEGDNLYMEGNTRRCRACKRNTAAEIRARQGKAA